MDIKEANEIVRVMCETKRTIEAVKLFRRATDSGLFYAKDFLEVFSEDGTNPTQLLQQLCTEFVQSKRDILTLLLEERRKLDLRIDQVQREIENEENQNNQRDSGVERAREVIARENQNNQQQTTQGE